MSKRNSHVMDASWMRRDESISRPNLRISEADHDLEMGVMLVVLVIVINVCLLVWWLA